MCPRPRSVLVTFADFVSFLNSTRSAVIPRESHQMELLQQYWVFLIPFVGVLWFLLTRVGSGSRTYPYEKKSSILTRNEQDFYQALQRAVGKEYAVFGMVRIADVLSVRRDGVAKRQSWQSRINCKHIDFLLCEVENQEPVLAIEVDDRSHQRKDRIERDHFVDRAFADAGLPLLRVQATRSYSARDLREAIAETMDSAGNKLASERRVRVG